MEEEVEAILKNIATSRESDGAMDPLPQFSQIQQTLAIIKPEALDKSDEIMNIIERESLTILQTRRVELTAEQASQFYQDMYELDFFADSVNTLSSGQVIAMVLCGPSAIEHWLGLINGRSDNPEKECPRPMKELFGPNSVHGSFTQEDAVRELHFFFPELIIHPIMSDKMSSLYLNEYVHPLLTIGLAKLIREKPDDPIVWLGDWLLENNPNKPMGASIQPC